MAAELGTHLENVRRYVTSELRLPSRSRVAVKVFASHAQMLEYNPTYADGAFSYYDKKHTEIVTFNTDAPASGSRKGRRYTIESESLETLSSYDKRRVDHLLLRIDRDYSTNTYGLVAREAWRQHLDEYLTSELAIRGWLNEGMAEFISALRFDEQEGEAFQVIPHATWSYQLMLWRRQRGTLPSWQSFMAPGTMLPQAPEHFYPRAGSIVTFLMIGPAKKSSDDLLPLEYVKRFRRNKSITDCDEWLMEALEEHGLQRLEAEWAKWVESIAGGDPLLELAATFGGHLPASAINGPEPLRTSWLQRLYQARVEFLKK